MLTEEEIDILLENTKKKANQKRGSMYDIENVMRKKSLSKKEAEKWVDGLKARTAGTLSNFKKRHGKIKGQLLYNEFCKKSAHTYENYQKWYGDDADFMWKKRQESLDSSSMDFFIRKYG